MSFFTRISTWRIPTSAFAQSLAEMARDGLLGNEGVALWLGHRGDGQAEITHVVALRGPGVIKRPDQLVLPPEIVNDVTDLAIQLGVVLVGQIHSHGAFYGTNLSFADRNFGIKVPYFLSLVAPDYALRTDTRLQDCGVHLFEPVTGFRRLSPSEVDKHITVARTSPVTLLTVGEG